MIIDIMKMEDVERVAELDKICFPTPWSISAYMSEVYNPSGFYIVARENNEIVGFAGEWIVMDEAVSYTHLDVYKRQLRISRE